MNWNLEIMVFDDRGKSWHAKKIRSSQRGKPTKNEVFSVIEVPPIQTLVEYRRKYTYSKECRGVCLFFFFSRVTLTLEVSALSIKYSTTFDYIDTSVLLENIALVKFIKTTSGTRVVYFP